MNTVRTLVALLCAGAMIACDSASPSQTPGTGTPATPRATATATAPMPTPTAPPATPTPARTDPGDTADIIFVNGVLLTMDEANPAAQAIAIRGNRILAVGADDDVASYRGSATVVIDLGGRAVTPGFIDSHTHRITQRYKWGFDSVEEAVQEALSQGWTGLTELAVDESQLQELRQAAEAGRLRTRVNAYLTANTFSGEPLPEWYNAYRQGQEFGPYLRIAGLKLFIDGNSGRILYFDPDGLTGFFRQRRTEGWEIAVKAIGIESHELALSAYEALLQGRAGDAWRYRIEHSLAVTDGQLSRMAQLGIIPSIQPSFPGVIWYEPDIHALVDEQGLENIFRWREYHDAGLIVAASPYNPDGANDELTLPSHVSPMGLLYRSLTQVGPGDSEPEPWMLEKTLAVEQILPMLTINGAYATSEEASRGSLTPGKLADIVILSEDPLQVAPARLKEIRALMTMVGGRVEHCAAGFESLCLGWPARTGPTPTPSVPPTDSVSLAPTASLSASASLTGQPPANAVDGNSETTWSAGAHPRQWIRFEFDAAHRIASMRLTVSQYPAGFTVHRIWGGDTEENVRLLGELRGETSDGQVLELELPTPAEDVRILYVVTTESPSWVAWREIEVFGE